MVQSSQHLRKFVFVPLPGGVGAIGFLKHGAFDPVRPVAKNKARARVKFGRGRHRISLGCHQPVDVVDVGTRVGITAGVCARIGDDKGVDKHLGDFGRRIMGWVKLRLAIGRGPFGLVLRGIHEVIDLRLVAISASFATSVLTVPIGQRRIGDGKWNLRLKGRLATGQQSRIACTGTRRVRPKQIVETTALVRGLRLKKEFTEGLLTTNCYVDIERAHPVDVGPVIFALVRCQGECLGGV